VTRWGIPFRSTLEAVVAEQLDVLGIEWAYERGLEDSIQYLPDFTILGEPDPAYQAPAWIEVKPADLLYRARDYFGIAERFDDDIATDATLEDFKQINPDLELAEAEVPCRTKRTKRTGRLSHQRDQPLVDPHECNRRSVSRQSPAGELVKGHEGTRKGRPGRTVASRARRADKR
jgi:hypothetical protein